MYKKTKLTLTLDPRRPALKNNEIVMRECVLTRGVM